MRSFVRTFCIFLLLSFAPFSESSAQVGNGSTGKQSAPTNLGGATKEQIEQQRSLMFQQMLRNPQDLDTAFAYATLSVRVGDIEAAISTLERMLIFAPGLPRLQLELGVLYFRVGAFDTAKTYLEAALAGPGVPQNVQDRVQAILDRIASANERDVFSAELRTGIRYQSNANRAPGSADVFLNGLPFRLGAGSTEDDDFNVYLAGSFHYAKDLESQGDTFEVDFVGYGSNQFERNQLDLIQGEITVGPAFDLGRFDIDDAKLGIYAIGFGVVLGDEFYSYGGGLGARLAARLNPQTTLVVKGEYRRRQYENSTSFPRADDRDGDEFRAAALARHIVNPNLLVSLGVQGQRSDVDQDFLSYNEVHAWGGPTFSIPSPISKDSQAWIANLTAGFVIRRFDSPDPVINLTDEQHDSEVYGRASLSIPFRNGWSVLAEAEYRNVNSNYDTRQYDNVLTTFSIVKKW